jgi:predicted acylesterase/phospholipase RssA
VLVDQLSRLNITQAFRIFADSVDIGSRQMAELRLKIDAPDVIIRPEVNGINLLDNVDVIEMAQRGEQAAEMVLPELRRASSLPARAIRQLRWFVQNG